MDDPSNLNGLLLSSLPQAGCLSYGGLWCTFIEDDSVAWQAGERGQGPVWVWHFKSKKVLFLTCTSFIAQLNHHHIQNSTTSRPGWSYEDLGHSEQPQHALATTGCEDAEGIAQEDMGHVGMGAWE